MKALLVALVLVLMASGLGIADEMTRINTTIKEHIVIVTGNVTTTINNTYVAYYEYPTAWDEFLPK